MSERAFPDTAGVQEEVRASELREWQLWSLTIGLLCLLAAGVVAGFYVLMDARAAEGTRPLLAGLALLTVLFCTYVVHARVSVARVRSLLNEMSGMVTANLEMRDYLTAIARGIAHTYHAPIVRILILRTNEPAVEIASTHLLEGTVAEPPEGYSEGLETLPLLRRAAEAPEPLVLDRHALRRLPAGDPQRTMLTGGVAGIDLVLALPLWTPRRRVGFLVLGFRHPRLARTIHHRMMRTVTTLARHAGTVIDDAIRRRESVRDPLTELYNRRHLSDRLPDEIRRAHRDGHPLAVLLCDLDRFKEINDTRGHPFGDEVLKQVAAAVRSATRGADLHFRWGGDELVVVLPKTDEEGVMVAAERIRSAVHGYARSAGLDLDVSIGVAIYPRHGTTEEELIRAADLAMYVAKKSGDKVRIGIDENPIDERSVSLVYQPIVDLASGKTRAHEVFSRDPEGNLSPVELFRKYHAVGQLGRLKRVIFEMQVQRARAAGVRRLFVHADLDFLERAEPTPIPEGLEVVIEISELDRNPRTEDRISVVRRWRRAGYGFAVDDFGAGFVSLPILARLKPEFVKIDRSSIVHAVESPEYREFLRHLLRAAAECAVGGIVAEGIERDVELGVARDLGASHAQGFLFGRPAPAASAGSDSGRPLAPEGTVGRP